MIDKSKLSPRELSAFERVLAGLKFSKMDTARKESAAMAAAVYEGLLEADGQSEGVLLANYPLLVLGTYEPTEGGTFTVEDRHLQDMEFALNRMVDIGKPNTLIYGHGSPSEGGYTIAADHIEGDTLYGHFYGDAFLIKGIRAGLYALSMEAEPGFQDKPYIGSDKTYDLWPTAWAALPPTKLGACPAQAELPLGELGKIAASRGKGILHFTTGGAGFIKGAHEPGKDYEMDEKQFSEMQSVVNGLATSVEGLVKAAADAGAGDEKSEIEELKAKNKELQEKLDAIKAENDKKTEEGVKAQVIEKQKIVAGRISAGAKKGFQERLDSKKTQAEKLAVLEDYEAILPETPAKGTPGQSIFSRTKGFNTEETPEATQEARVAFIRRAGEYAIEHECTPAVAMKKLKAEEEKG